MSTFKFLKENISSIRKLKSYPEHCIDFSSNDYLGLAKDAEVIQAGVNAALEYGSGSTGSRLISGNKQIFVEFEKTIAKDKNAEDALIFNSGFQANSGVIECLCDRDTVLVFDKLNHASMYFGAFASKSRLVRFNHLDYNHLESILKKEQSKPVIIASETVFGMDGDVADVAILSHLANKYGAFLYLDEAHATGLYGKHGYGISTDYSFDPSKTLIMGTFSKALGSSGAYIATSKVVKKYLIQNCKSFIYSTALSPFCVGVAMQAWLKVTSLGDVRKVLLATAQNVRNRLKAVGAPTIGHNTNILAVVFNDKEEMLKAKDTCLENGIILAGITQPTTPTPRLRIAINAWHSNEMIDALIKVLTTSIELT